MAYIDALTEFTCPSAVWKLPCGMCGVRPSISVNSDLLVSRLKVARSTDNISFSFKSSPVSLNRVFHWNAGRPVMTTRSARLPPMLVVASCPTDAIVGRSRRAFRCPVTHVGTKARKLYEERRSQSGMRPLDASQRSHAFTAPRTVSSLAAGSSRVIARSAQNQ